MILFNAEPKIMYPVDHDWDLTTCDSPQHTVIDSEFLVPAVQDGPMPVFTTRDLTLEEGALLTPSVRCKGFLVRVAGNLVVKSGARITMTARGASAVPDDLGIDFWKGQVDILTGGDPTRHYAKLLGKLGGIGAAAQYSNKTTAAWTSPADGINGACGGGGSGRAWGGHGPVYSGSGSQGTVYSGGAGGGSISTYGITGTRYGNNGGANGGSGGNAIVSSTGTVTSAGGGAGNDGGAGATYGNPALHGTAGQNGTGGLLIIMALGKILIEEGGIVDSRGSIGGTGGINGGASGSGAIHLFHHKEFTNAGLIDVSKISTYASNGSSSITHVPQILV